MLQQIQFNQNTNRANTKGQVIPIKNKISFGEIQRSLSILKTDTFQRGIENVVEKELIERSGCKIVKEKLFNPMPTKLAENHYAEHAEKPFFRSVIDYITGGKSKVMIFEGDEAVTKLRQATLEVRDKYAPGEKQRNLAHASDSLESANREIGNFFSEEA